MSLLYALQTLFGTLHPPRFDNNDLNAGQGLVEYALILVLVAVVVIVILSTVGTVIANTMYGNIVNSL